MIIVPGIGGIGIVSPPLDKNGNSVRGLIAGRKLVRWLLKKKIWFRESVEIASPQLYNVRDLLGTFGSIP